MKRLVLALLAATLAYATVSASQSLVNERYKEVAASVVTISTNELVVRGADTKEAFNIPAQGSGVLILNDGYVLTAAHLVDTADEITVKFGSGELRKASVFASEPAADIALLKLESVPASAHPAQLGDSNTVQIGEEIFIVGSPFEFESTITVGHVSNRRKPKSPFGAFGELEMFQTDAHIYPGSSGSPMFNLRGEVVGIATQVNTSKNPQQSMGFSVTSNIAKALLLDRRSMWTGFSGFWLSDGLAMALNVPQSAGLLVQRIAGNSPASRLRLQGGTVAATIGDDKFVIGGDIILSIQGISLAEAHGYEKARKALSRIPNGETLHLRILRAGQQMDLAVPLDFKGPGSQ